jgi:hypothetical protein
VQVIDFKTGRYKDEQNHLGRDNFFYKRKHGGSTVKRIAIELYLDLHNGDIVFM